MDIVEFLTARIRDDELIAGAGFEPESWCDRSEGVHYDYKRVVAECEAKRKIIALYNEEYDNLENNWDETYEGSTRVMSTALDILVLPYREHPDFDPRWSE